MVDGRDGVSGAATGCCFESVFCATVPLDGLLFDDGKERSGGVVVVLTEAADRCDTRVMIREEWCDNEKEPSISFKEYHRRRRVNNNPLLDENDECTNTVGAADVLPALFPSNATATEEKAVCFRESVAAVVAALAAVFVAIFAVSIDNSSVTTKPARNLVVTDGDDDVDDGDLPLMVTYNSTREREKVIFWYHNRMRESFSRSLIYICYDVMTY